MFILYISVASFVYLSTLNKSQINKINGKSLKIQITTYITSVFSEYFKPR